MHCCNDISPFSSVYFASLMPWFSKWWFFSWSVYLLLPSFNLLPYLPCFHYLFFYPCFRNILEIKIELRFLCETKAWGFKRLNKCWGAWEMLGPSVHVCFQLIHFLPLNRHHYGHSLVRSLAKRFNICCLAHRGRKGKGELGLMTVEAIVWYRL